MSHEIAQPHAHDERDRDDHEYLDRPRGGQGLIDELSHNGIGRRISAQMIAASEPAH